MRLENMLFFLQLTMIFVGNTIGECKCSPCLKKKKGLDALGNCSTISTMPQINLDVLHPSGDYMES